MKKVREYAIIGILGLVVGIMISIFYNNTINTKSSDSDTAFNIDAEYDEEDISKIDNEGIFSKDYYKYLVLDGYANKIRKINIDEKTPDDYAITKDDEDDILKNIVGIKYDTEIKENDNFVSYTETKDGVYTGAYAGFVYGEDGQLSQLFFRVAQSDDLSLEDVITEDDAKNIAIEYARDKYADSGELVIEDDFKINLYYKPEVGNCYEIIFHGNLSDNNERIAIGVVINASSGEIIDELSFL